MLGRASGAVLGIVPPLYMVMSGKAVIGDLRILAMAWTPALTILESGALTLSILPPP